MRISNYGDLGGKPYKSDIQTKQSHYNINIVLMYWHKNELLYEHTVDKAATRSTTRELGLKHTAGGQRMSVRQAGARELTFSDAAEVGELVAAADLGPRLVLQPLGRRVGVRVLQAHAARQQEAPHHVVDLAPAHAHTSGNTHHA